MCVIAIQITNPSEAIETAAEGRYKLTSSQTWTNFPISDYTSASTPDILPVGTYNLEVRVRSVLGVWSLWTASTFEVSATTCP